MKKVCRCHGRNGSVQERTAKCRLGRGNSGLESGGVTEPIGTTIWFDLLRMDFKHLIKRQEDRFHHSASF
jgi:hypothetical protein